VDASGFWIKFVLDVLATWRISHLLASEDGPLDIIVRIRKRLGAGFIGQLMDCFQCLSFWVAAPLALSLARQPVEWFISWLALSGAACLLEKIGQEPLIIQTAAQETEGGDDDGMLRTETGGDLEYSRDDIKDTRRK
jgi:hypothetical protein